MGSQWLRCHCIADVKFCDLTICFVYNCSLLQKKALFHKNFFSLKRGSVTCMLLLCLSLIYCLLISDDLDIDSQQVVYYGLKLLLERMTNHLKIPKGLSQNFLETDGRFWFFPELSLPCQKNFVEASRVFQMS